MAANAGDIASTCRKIHNTFLYGYYPLKVQNQPKSLKCFNDAFLRTLSTNDGLSLFTIYNGMLTELKAVKNEIQGLNIPPITKLIDKIIPFQYFGCQRNKKLFYQIIRKILTQSNHECIFLSHFWMGFKYERIPWLKQIEDEKFLKKCLLYFNKKVMDTIVKPLISHYYFMQISHKGHEVTFIQRRKWQIFFDKNLKNLLALKYLVPMEQNEKRTPRGQLRLFPRKNYDNLDCRTIMYVNNLNKTKDELMREKAYCRYLAKEIKIAANRRCKYGNLYTTWTDFISANKDFVIDGVKLDIKDAFGSVDIKELIDIVKVTWSLKECDKNAIIERLKHQYVSLYINKKQCSFKWTHGLLQGDVLSSSLCELYITYQEEMILKHFDRNLCFIHRTVDDFIFCSRDPLLIYRFTQKIGAFFDLNESKTISTALQKVRHLTYAGRIFNLDTGEITKLYKFEENQSLRHKFKLWNINKPVSRKHNSILITRAMTYDYLNMYFSKYELNTKVNREETVLKNLFYGFIYSAYKFDCAVMAVKDYNEDFSFLKNIIRKVIRDYCRRTHLFIKVYKGEYFKLLNFPLVFAICCKAFILVLKKRSVFYKNLIKFIKTPNAIVNGLNSNIVPLKGIDKDLLKHFSRLPDNFKNIQMKRVPMI